MFERKKQAGKIYFLPIDQIRPSPFQARREFSEQELAALAQSIRENGLLQPISVRKVSDGGYELVAGERRLRACRLAKMNTIPAILCDYDDERTAALGLLENIQRADLNPFEQAQGLKDVMVLWDCTQAEAAKRLGMAQPTFANKLRLLQLNADQRQFVLDNGLTERHARALLRLHDEEMQMHVIQIIVQQNLNVKATEDLVERTISRMYGIEKEEEEQSRTRPSKISGFVRDTRLFVNSLRTVVQQMTDAGLNPKLESRDKEEGMEIKIWIPHPAAK